MRIWNDFPHARGCLFHVPNEGQKSAREGAILKSMGVIPGVPDLILIWGGKTYGFEMKTTTGVLSPAQKKLHAVWGVQGVVVEVVRSSDELYDRVSAIITQ